MPSTELSAVDTVTNKPNTISTLTVLGAQGMSRKDKCQTNTYMMVFGGGAFGW